jgi:hypothetical protein
MTDTATKPMGPLSTHAPCSLHKAHDPTPVYCETHHVVPQAWQLHWQPREPWPNGGPSPDHAGVTLWDARTVVICRTGHGNVHYWLVEIMHALADLGITIDRVRVEQAMHDVRAVRLQEGHAPGHAEFDCAEQAILRYGDAGGSIPDLIANHLWGQI